MASGLGVLARLTQQASQNRVNEQNFRSGLAGRLRAEVTQNREIRIREQADLAARNDRDLDREQRDKRAAERIAQEDKSIAAANLRAQISASSRIAAAKNKATATGIIDEKPDQSISKITTNEGGLKINDGNRVGGVTPGETVNKLGPEDSPKSLIDNEKIRKRAEALKGEANALRIANEKELSVSERKGRRNTHENILARNKVREQQANALETKANVMLQTNFFKEPKAPKQPTASELSRISSLGLIIDRNIKDGKPPTHMISTGDGVMQLQDAQVLHDQLQENAKPKPLEAPTQSKNPPVSKEAKETDIKLNGSTSGRAALKKLL